MTLVEQKVQQTRNKRNLGLGTNVKEVEIVSMEKVAIQKKIQEAKLKGLTREDQRNQRLNKQ
jgi:hypothetical protein